jgi:hypothetical protein
MSAIAKGCFSGNRKEINEMEEKETVNQYL